MTFLDIMYTYFRGEKLEAFWFILPIGILFIIFGVVALKAERGGFAWGIAIPCFLVGIIFIGTGAGVGFRTARQVADLERGFKEQPAQMIKKELPRMEKVNTNFRMTFFIFGAVVALGLLIHYLGGPECGRGLGAVLILAGAIGLLIDGFAERRAVPYTTALEEMALQYHNVNEVEYLPYR